VFTTMVKELYNSITTFYKDLLNTGGPRVHSFAAINASVTMVILSLGLGLGAIYQRKVTTEFVASITCLCGLGGYVYKQGKNRT